MHAYVDPSLSRQVTDVLKLPERNPNRHLLMDAFQRRLVHNAMALGRALKRKVIMPKMMCWCAPSHLSPGPADGTRATAAAATLQCARCESVVRDERHGSRLQSLNGCTHSTSRLIGAGGPL